MLFFLIGIWKTFAFKLIWLGERWVPLSLHIWGLTYYVWCQGCLTSVLSIFVPCRSCTYKLPYFLQVLCHRETHTHTTTLRRWLYFIPETRFRRQAKNSDQRKVVRGSFWCGA